MRNTNNCFKKTIKAGQQLLVLILLTGLFPSGLKAQTHKVLFDKGWRFQLGKASNVENPSYDDASWRLLNLPHDWSVEPLNDQIPGKTIGPFSKESPGGEATGQTMGGEGWYRKTFTIPAEDAGKWHELYFEGIYNQSEIWVNGKKAYQNVYGYTTFRFDISKYCNAPGKENIIAVKVSNLGKNSRWYSGSGIFRHVWMIKTPSSYLDNWGTFIHTRNIANQQASVALTTAIVNRDKTTSDFTVHVELLSP